MIIGDYDNIYRGNLLVDEIEVKRLRKKISDNKRNKLNDPKKVKKDAYLKLTQKEESSKILWILNKQDTGTVLTWEEKEYIHYIINRSIDSKWLQTEADDEKIKIAIIKWYKGITIKWIWKKIKTFILSEWTIEKY